MRHAGLVLSLMLGLTAGCSDTPPATARDGAAPRAADEASEARPARGAGSGSGFGAPEQTRRADGGSAPLPRVVFLGTSLTAGYGLDAPDAQAWGGRVAALADSAGLPVEVVNAGSSGDTSSGGLRRLEWILQEPLDLLVVELGANDGLRGQSVDALADNLREIVDRTRAARPDARVALVAMEAPRNMGSAYVERFRRVFPTVAGETGAALVPFPLDSVAGRPGLNQPDGIHPTARGHDLMARAAWPHLRSLFQELHDRDRDAPAPVDTVPPGGSR